jgi:uracil phosphoribosyltransferase
MVGNKERLRIMIDPAMAQGKTAQDLTQLLQDAEIIVAKVQEIDIIGEPFGEIRLLRKTTPAAEAWESKPA